MKKLLYLTLSSLLLIFSCQKENIDEVFVEEFVFEADTSIQKGGRFVLIAKGDTIIDESGYAFMCRGFRGDTTDFMISNNEYSSLSHYGFEKPDIEISADISWIEENGQQLTAFYASWREINSNKFFSYVAKKPIDINIIEQDENFIKMEFKGSSFETFGAGERLPYGEISGFVEVPIYQNCERGLPIISPNPQSDFSSSVSVRLPYNPPIVLPIYHISCDDGGVQRNLITTIPNSFEQFRQNRHSLLQNENDFYISWEVKGGELYYDFSGGINVNLPTFKGITEFASHYTNAIPISNYLYLFSRENNIRMTAFATLKDPIADKLLGKCIITGDYIINQLESCD